MSNHMSLMRTSYFNVTDPEAFKTEIDALEMDGVKVEIGEDQRVIVLGGRFDLVYITDPDDEENVHEIDVFEIIQKNLVDGEAVLVNGIGWEKLRYISASSTIITPAGIVYVDPQDAVRDLAVANKLLSNEQAQALNCTY